MKKGTNKTVREEEKWNSEEKENSEESWPAFAVVSDCAGGRFGEQEVQQTPVILISASISTARLEQNPESHTHTVHACSASPGPCLTWGFEPLCQLNLY